MIKAVFIRHGATKGNLEKRYIGSTDEQLCEAGVGQALRLRENNFPEEYIFVSPMKRTKQTAELIFPGRRYTEEENFREMDFGIFEGKNASELSENIQYRNWVDSMCTLPVPGGEGVEAFKKRCAEAFEMIVKSLPDEADVAFVVHGGVIMAILEAFSEDNGNFYDYHLKNGEFLMCEFENRRLRIL